MKNIAQALDRVREKLRAAERQSGRPEGTVALLAVSKTRPAAEVLEAARAGQRAFGENYVQEAVAKIRDTAGNGLSWHFIGPVQSNKARDIACNFDWVHSLDRIRIARRLHALRPDGLAPLNVCIQINIDGEDSKSGVAPGQAAELAQAIAELPRLRLRGLMTLPAPRTEFEAQRVPFARLRACLQELKQVLPTLDTLSMGTTADMAAAVAEGATIVRVGTAIFGPRGT
jgi:PLP dependent protein